MKYKIISITSVLILVLVVALLFQIKMPLCYASGEKPSPETFILYDSQVIAQVKENIRQSPFHYVKVNGQSMQPSIRHRDMCVCLPQETYKVDDIVSFYIPSENNKVELIIHRIVDDENNKFTTRGDNNNIIDSWELTKDQIFCKVPEKNLFDKFRFAIVESERFSIFSIFG